ncbi:MAG: hypothetical protein H6736_14920 [Alphaproteobacteria bacterium]|nr:hypothetical protein [Alphaproteobacteria bacterium]MCB9693100.1 hypothetical protein [Alphaproteobacteria bacterium]
MDIWSWVGEHLEPLWEQDPALAEQIDELSTWTCDGEHARVDAALPAIVARVQKLGLPWLEVFVRHWGLQSRILHRQDARDDALREAVDLVERAHRPDAIGCPQAVCATQDLCAAYGVLDGPGYADERIRAAEEALERIHPGWPCFRCIQGEVASALLDAGRPEEVLTLATRAEREMREHGNDDDLGLSVSWALLDLGRFEEALEVARTYDNRAQGEMGRLSKSLRVAHALVRMGRFDDAMEELPAFSAFADEVEDFPELLLVWMHLVRAGELGFDEVDRNVATTLQTLSRHCTHRQTVDRALDWAGLYAEHDRWALASVCLELADVHIPQLARPLGADARRAEVGAAVDARRPAVLGDTAEAVQEALGDEDGVAFDEAYATSLAHPGLLELVRPTAERWIGLGWPDVATRLLDRALASSPDDPELLASVLSARLQADDLVGLERALEAASGVPSARPHVRWFRSRLHLKRGELPAAESELDALWREDRDEVTTAVARSLASVRQRLGRVEEALDALADLGEGATDDDHWFRMELATQLARWDVVREAASAVDIHLPGEGMIDLQGEPLLLRFADHPDLWARRIGPCHARVMTISAPSPERYGSVWAFDPFSAEGDDPRAYAANSMLEGATAVGFAVDGARLEPEAMARLEAFAEAHGGAVYTASGPQYVLFHPDEGDRIEAGFVKVAVPDDPGVLGRLHALLGELARGASPLVWPELREAVGDAAGAAADRDTAERWGM